MRTTDSDGVPLARDAGHSDRVSPWAMPSGPVLSGMASGHPDKPLSDLWVKDLAARIVLPNSLLLGRLGVPTWPERPYSEPVTPLPENLSARISEDDRDAAVRRLQEAYAEGLIAHEEMDEGLDRAFAAGTRAELMSVLASLPEQRTSATSSISAATGRIRRSGVWRVAQTLKVESAMGRVRLDLSRAVIEHPVVVIELLLGTGKATIIVPREAVVDVGGLTTVWKDTRYKPPRRSRSTGPTIRITGTMGLGRLKIRHARH
jgi:hypothetical protein